MYTTDVERTVTRVNSVQTETHDDDFIWEK